MKTLKLSIFAFLFSVISAPIFAQSADEVIAKYFTTIGGVEKLKPLKGIKMDMSIDAQGMEIPVEMVQLAGGKMYVKLSLQGKEITQMASDGKTIWSTNFMTMKAEKSDAETTANALLSNNDFPDALLDYKAKGYAAEFVGKETKEGTECFKLKFTKKPVTINGVKMDDVSYYYFDTENYLPIVTETEIKAGPMKGQKAVSTMSDYQEVDGIYFPFSMNMGGQTMKIKKITLNPTVAETSFAFPTE
ncbi:outer membrane lipoprotein-sorting protein [Flavobacterium sp. K5-23]|uniref:outer membrane lipoprotein-sorting protein n=1 Tax=Flavobacterium sp. K5-23 TaxID=2746225 RepID=UPI00200D38F7|nr:outer membrane lipoprotein-sorting protein [Flavobacterium sp. K5-23]UQD57626.1 outer membrane lipoprotein-sorting protein [Flavobacterium sp. K5-23]